MSRDLYVFPASPGQEWMWLIHHMFREASPYRISGVVRLRGPLDIGLLSRSLDLLVERHEALRTVFRLEPSGDVSQVIRPAERVELETVDLTGGAAGTDERAHAQLRALCMRPFDLAQGPLVRAAVIRIGPDDHMLGLVLHHIVSDGWSMGVVTSELAETYALLVAGDPPDLPEPALQYADFALWHREWLASDAAADHVAYWTRKLDGAEPLRLPIDPAAPGVQASPLGSLRLGPATAAALAETARAEGTTVFMVLLSAFAAILARWSGQQDFVITVPVAGRPQPELAGTVGFFVNTLPIRVNTSGDPTLRELLHRVRAGCLEAYDHQDVPYETMVRKAAWRRDGPGARLGPVMFALRAPLGPPLRAPAGLTMELQEITPTAGEMDVFAELVDVPGQGLHGHLAGNGARVGQETMDLLADSLTRVLTVAAAGGGTRVPDLPVPLAAPHPVGGS
ncbi:condensation domain-containing protein [Streptomyces caelestis]|uniref:Condensation domain-containing protein n=1 Tax=Streptomyces caelestis TaxID=36816 RepID=A0A7W9LWA1_9ACTN|nr:condensation domain-containing protein [Streptomyces caelestis]MBB5798521.1 hypothetical protein [Streptomyces caelestis]